MNVDWFIFCPRRQQAAAKADKKKHEVAVKSLADGKETVPSISLCFVRLPPLASLPKLLRRAAVPWATQEELAQKEELRAPVAGAVAGRTFFFIFLPLPPLLSTSSFFTHNPLASNSKNMFTLGIEPRTLCALKHSLVARWR